MTKAIMMSIQPKWVEKILNGEKTIEVRKTAPKLKTPFKVYVYCTKQKYRHTSLEMYLNDDDLWKTEDNFVGMGPKFFDDNIEDIVFCEPLNGKVVAEFTCDRIDEIDCSSYAHIYYSKDSCLSADDFIAYCNGQDLYAWYISDLKIYDTPRELSEFKSVKCIRGYHKADESKIKRLTHASRVKVKALTRPFQSWGYVEEQNND